MKKIIAGILGLAMVFTLSPVWAFAADTPNEQAGEEPVVEEVLESPEDDVTPQEPEQPAELAEDEDEDLMSFDLGDVDDLYLFKGKKSSFTLNTDKFVQKNGAYDSLNWKVEQIEDSYLGGSVTPIYTFDKTKHYSVSGKTISFSETQVKNIAKVLDFEESSEIYTLLITVSAVVDDEEVYTTEHTVSVVAEYNLPEDFEFPERIVKGDTVELDSEIVIEARTVDFPYETSVEGKITSIKSSKADNIAVSKDGDKYKLFAKGKTGSSASLTMNYSFSLGGKTYTGSMKTESDEPVEIVKELYYVSLNRDDLENDYIIPGQVRTLTATCKHAYYGTKFSCDTLEGDIFKLTNDGNATTFKQVEESNNSWEIEVNPNRTARDTIDYYSVDLKLNVDEDLVVNEESMTFEVVDSYYSVVPKAESIDLKDYVGKPIVASDIAQVMKYDSEHPDGVACDDINESLCVDDYDKSIFNTTADQLYLNSAAKLAKLFDAGLQKTTLYFAADDYDFLNDEITLKLGCTHDMYEEYELEPATMSANGKMALWTCSACGRSYSSEAATKRISERQVINKVASVALGKTSMTYTGKAYAPEVTVKDSKKVKLVEGTDYTVVYKDSKGELCDEIKDAGSYSVVVSGKGDYDFTATKSFTVAQATKTVNVSTSTGGTVAYVDKEKLVITGSSADDAEMSYKVTSGKCASVDSKSGVLTATAAGTVKVTVTAAATKNYKAASKVVSITVKNPTDVAGKNITTIGAAQWNGGNKVEPAVTVKSGKTVFKKGTDYKVECELLNSEREVIADPQAGDWEVGNYVRVTVDATDKNALACKGTFTKDVVITKAAQPATASVPATIYTGSGKEPVQIKIDGKPSSEGDENPTITYKQTSKAAYGIVDANGLVTPVKAGTVAVTVTIGETEHYAAKTIKLSTKVKAATDISSGKLITIKAGYNDGNPVEPDVTVKGFAKGTDYTVEYDNTGITAVGQTIDVTVKAIAKSGGCLGSYTKTVTVGKGEQDVKVTKQPTTVKAKSTTDAFEVTGVKDGALVTATSKTYASVNNLGGGKYSITGIKKGTATVTIKIAATEKYNAKTITFKVSVTK